MVAARKIVNREDRKNPLFLNVSKTKKRHSHTFADKEKKKIISIQRAKFLKETPAFIKKRRRKKKKGKRLEGVKYEYKVQGFLLANYFAIYTPSPWISYTTTDGRESVAQPDGFLLDEDRMEITLIEIKLRHCAESYWQLRGLYEPLLSKIYPKHEGWKYKLLEICRWYDGTVSYPETYKMVDDILNSPFDRIGVHIWNS